MSNPRRDRFLAWFKRTYRDQDGELNRARFMADTSKSGLEPLTKGRVSQLFDEKQPFGEVAARRLAERLLLRPDFFDSEDREDPTPPREAISAEEIDRWRMCVADDDLYGSPGVTIGDNKSGKSYLLGAMVQFADLAKTGVGPPQRKLLAQMVGSLFEDGPSENTAQAIDAFTRELDEPAKHLTSAWRKTAHTMAAAHPDQDVRELLLKFVDAVDSATQTRDTDWT